MYVEPDASGAPAANTALPVIGAMSCGTLLLFILAATIVLALIPVYVPEKSALLSSSLTASNEFTMYLPVDSAATGRRRRQQSAASNPLMLSSVQSNGNVQSVTVSIVDVTVDDTSRRRRFSFSKRQNNLIIMLRVTCVLQFKPKCGFRCQNTNGDLIAALLQSNLPSRLSLINIPILNSGGGLCQTMSSIRVSRVRLITLIRSGRFSMIKPTVRPTFSITGATVTSVTSTTVIIPTGSMG
ncbi:unnamed protein product [Rotaria sordida]|uniref:Uncharacterized protein n=1 Tax=Rotaria sordida TaxID=392033 RepID=A0A813RK70_9BILA|nr:unnamed protein product [Rotaria sordida]